MASATDRRMVPSPFLLPKVAKDENGDGDATVLGRSGLLSSVRRLVGTLLSGDGRDVVWGRPRKRMKLESNCRQKALEALLRSQGQKQKSSDSSTLASLSPFAEISGYCFDLTLQGQESRASKIEKCLHLLRKRADGEQHSDAILPVLKLLSLLKNSSPQPLDDDAVQLTDRFEAFFPFRSALPQRDEKYSSIGVANKMRRLDPGPFLPGEIVETRSVRAYPHYSASTFEFDFEAKSRSSAAAANRNPYNLPSLDLMQQAPGTGLSLIRCGEVGAKNLKLDFPPLELIADRNGRFLRVPITPKETLKKAKCVIVKRQVLETVKEELDDSSIWENIWEVELPQRRTWEALGKINPVKEKPYMMEIGNAGVHRSWLLTMENLRLIDPATIIPKLNVLSEEKMLADIGYLMIGIASETFIYYESQDKLAIRAGTCIDGITPETFSSYCEEFLRCGTICRRLEAMCGFQPKTPLRRVFTTGLIQAGFLQGISKYLQGYRTTVLNIVKRKRLLQLSAALAQLASQIQFLGRLCKVDEERADLPSGIELLCYLFDRTLHINTKDLYFVLVSILRSSADPYFRFLKCWIFQGIYRDDFREFGLECNTHFLGERNRVFWTNTHFTSEFPLDASICREGNFISEIQQQVFICGKSLNLLKLCQPRHHLCTPIVDRQPHIQLFSFTHGAKLKSDCHQYVDLMEAIARERTTSLQMQKKIEEDAKKELLRVAHKRHKDQLERIRQHRKSVLEEENRRKRIVFEGLRDQLIAERKRKADEKEKKLKDDKMWAEFAQKKAEEDIKREEDAKRDMELYYKKLTEEAEARESRAKWKVRRLELRSERIRFWRNENKKMQEFMKNLERNEELKKDLSMVTEEAPLAWKSVRVQEDEMKNIVLVLEDQESNIIHESVSNFGDFTTDIREKILTQNFESLPDWTRSKLMENVGKKMGPAELDGVEGSFVRRTKVSSSTKRKRPDSFVESAEKRVEVIDQSAVHVEPRHKEPPPSVYVSLAAALSKDEDSPKRRPKELTVIDGRKRPTSKSIEEILYPSRFSQASASATPVTPSKTEFRLLSASTVKPYADDFNLLNSAKVDAFPCSLLSLKPKYQADPQAFTPLTMLMENSILIPLRAQLTVVNASVLNYLLVDARLMNHFRALRSYLLFHDGEFAHHLSCSLFCQVRDDTAGVLNPATLSRIVENALMSSTFGCKDPLAANVGFVYHGLSAENGYSDVFDRLKLGYTTEWPMNIILTDEVVGVYGDIFQFLLQLKKAVWGLEQVYVDLKSLRGFESSVQVRKVHLIRHDMLNFVNVTQDYVKTQVLDVSWAEFERDIESKVFSVDSLFEAHNRYLSMAKKRCILNPSGKQVKKLIINIFNIISNFSCILTKTPWNRNSQNEATHPSFVQIEENYNYFREHSSYLYSVVNKLAARGYENHLPDLLLCLNYNGYYDKK